MRTRIAHNDAWRRDGRPRDGVFAVVEPYPPEVDATVCHVLAHALPLREAVRAAAVMAVAVVMASAEG